MNYIFISPNFPTLYSKFVKALNDRGVNVFGIGDQRFDELNDELKENLKEYCYVSDLSNTKWMIETIQYLKNKYGDIDFIESNNEYWMMNDAKYREWFNVKNGYRYHDLEVFQSKSGMKKYFEQAGAKVARYHLVTSLEESIKFIEKVGYPVFAKPDHGVGAADTFKISNIDELKSFHLLNLPTQYIMEEYLDGYIISFDGVADKNGDVVIAFNETFPTPIDKVVKEKMEIYYYAKTKMNKEFYNLGSKVIKSFEVRQRCFHTEYFVLTKDKEGLGKKGDIVGLEINLRSPGGSTPNLLNLTTNYDYFEAYADSIVDSVKNIDYETSKFAVSVSRRDGNKYLFNNEQIFSKYGNNIKDVGRYSKEFRDAMGDEFYIAVFDNKKEMDEFIKFIYQKN